MSREIFLVASRQMKDITPVYRLKDKKNEMLKGNFYEKEMQKVPDDNVDKTYTIEKVIKKSKNKYFVKWLGFSAKYNSWVNKEDCLNLQTPPGDV